MQELVFEIKIMGTLYRFTDMNEFMEFCIQYRELSYEAEDVARIALASPNVAIPETDYEAHPSTEWPFFSEYSKRSAHNTDDTGKFPR